MSNSLKKVFIFHYFYNYNSNESSKQLFEKINKYFIFRLEENDTKNLSNIEQSFCINMAQFYIKSTIFNNIKQT